jgi:cell division septal protein FtsQ
MVTRSREKTKSKRQKKRHIFRVIIFVSGLILLSLFLWLCWFLLHWQALQIQNISIKGNTTIDTEKIYLLADDYLGGSYLGVIPYRNFLFLPKTDLVKQLIQSNLRIKDVEINRNGRQAIDIIISEFKDFALVCDFKQESCFYTDQYGYIFRNAPIIKNDPHIKFIVGDVGLYQLGQNLMSSGVFEKIISFSQSLDVEGIQTGFIYIKDDENFELQILAGPKILLNERTLDEAKAKLMIVLEDTESDISKNNLEKIDYIDLRYARKVFYLPQNSTGEF